MTISQVIKQELRRQQISVNKLSQATGYSQEYIYHLLRGKKRWNETVLSKVCQALNLQLEIKPADDTIPRAAGE